MTKRAADADVVIMAAAVADFRPVAVADAKIKKGDQGPAPPIELTTNPDILRGLVEARDDGRIPPRRPSSSDSPPRPATRPAGSSTTVAQSSPARVATCWW